MFKPLVGTFKFIRAERNQGIGKPEKGSVPYDFGTVRIADEHDSYTVDVNPELVERLNHEFKKGEFVRLTFEIGERFKNTTFKVDHYEKVQSLPKAN